MARYHLLTHSLLDKIEQMDHTEQAYWLFLDASDEFKGRWSVSSLWPDWFMDFEKIVGHYRTVSPATLEDFLDHAESGGYEVVFEKPPETILTAFEHLGDPPPFSIHSSLSESPSGLLPWQIQGFNKLIRDESLTAGLVIWDTGTGKTAFIASALKWHSEVGHPYDLALVVVKKNNKTDMQRKLKAMADIDALIIQGPPAQRQRAYAEVDQWLQPSEFAQPKAVAILNYETFRQDEDIFRGLVHGRDLLVFWDEMPTRLSNRKTQVYKAVKGVLWDKWETRTEKLAGAKPRANWMRQWELTATPIENSPEGLFNCLRLMKPPLLGNVDKFRSTYVSYTNPISGEPEKWHHLDRLEGIIEHMTHRVSRKDPEVAAMFPEVMEDSLVIDWDERDRKVYDTLSGKAAKIIKEENVFEEANVLALIQILQMVCDAPSMVNESAKNREAWLQLIEDDPEAASLRTVKGSELATQLLSVLRKPPTDEHHTKFETLREILQEKHPDDKALVYMTWASYGFAPVTAKLDEWEVSYVQYTGTDKQRQEAKDAFRSDPSIQVFLSSDKGSDSIDLPEAAVGVNYNLPWTWTRKRQRQGRNDRVDSKLDTTYWYDLLMAGSVEDRKRQIIETKKGYHTQLFDGKAHEDSVSAKLTREDLIYILTGSSA